MVYGVFSGGVYLLRSDGKMLLLHDRDNGALPFGLQTDGILGMGRKLGFELYEPLLLEHGIIRQQCSQISLILQYEPMDPATPSVSFQEAYEILRMEAIRSRTKKNSELFPFAIRCVKTISKSSLTDPFAAAGFKGMRLL